MEKQSRRQRQRKVATDDEAPGRWLERSAGARAYNGSAQSRGRAPGRGVRAKLPEAERFDGPLADIVRFTNLFYGAFYGQQKEMVKLSTSLLFESRTTDGF